MNKLRLHGSLQSIQLAFSNVQIVATPVREELWLKSGLTNITYTFGNNDQFMLGKNKDQYRFNLNGPTSNILNIRDTEDNHIVLSIGGNGLLGFADGCAALELNTSTFQVSIGGVPMGVTEVQGTTIPVNTECITFNVVANQSLTYTTLNPTFTITDFTLPAQMFSSDIDLLEYELLNAQGHKVFYETKPGNYNEVTPQAPLSLQLAGANLNQASAYKFRIRAFENEVLGYSSYTEIDFNTGGFTAPNNILVSAENAEILTNAKFKLTGFGLLKDATITTNVNALKYTVLNNSDQEVYTNTVYGTGIGTASVGTPYLFEVPDGNLTGGQSYRLAVQLFEANHYGWSGTIIYPFTVSSGQIVVTHDELVAANTTELAPFNAKGNTTYGYRFVIDSSRNNVFYINGFDSHSVIEFQNTPSNSIEDINVVNNDFNDDKVDLFVREVEIHMSGLTSTAGIFNASSFMGTVGANTLRTV